jgi:hypothetical protein
MEELIPIFLFICIAAVMILRPLTKRLGLVLEQMARDRSAVRADDAGIARLRVELEHVSKRMELMEERVDFTERLVASSRRATRPEPEFFGREPAERLRYDERAPYLAP